MPQSPRIASRWYSDTTEAVKEDADASKGESAAQGKPAEIKLSEPEELKQQLEKREREVIDLKVCIPLLDAEALVQKLSLTLE